MRPPALQLLVLLLIGVPPSQAAVQLVTNGDFETGNLDGWRHLNQTGGTGDFLIDAPGTTTPTSVFATAANASGGSFYAVSDTSGPGAHVLLQPFVVSASPLSVILSFQMFVNNAAATANINAAGLDYTVTPNQHARVDILAGTAAAFASTVLRNLYLGTDAGTNPRPYRSYSFDITSVVATPGTYILRFGQVDNQGVLNQGVDNVSIIMEVPEASTFFLLLLAGSSGFLRRRVRTNFGFSKKCPPMWLES